MSGDGLRTGAGIRPFRDTDLTALRRICELTAFDPLAPAEERMLADIYLEPYVRFAPDWVQVLDLDDGPVGYCIAVPDTRAFIDWWAREWTPVFRARHADDVAALADSGAPGATLSAIGTDPARLSSSAVDAYPAHLHIDLLPEAQGHGAGGVMIDRLIARLGAAGVPGVHLGVHPDNTGAKRFYARHGFAPFEGDENRLVRAT